MKSPEREMSQRYCDYNQIPFILSVKDLIDILNLSEDTIYTVTHRQDFPIIVIGNRRLVRKDRLFEWIKEQESEICDERRF